MVDSLDDVGRALPALAGRREATATIGVANKCPRDTNTGTWQTYPELRRDHYVRRHPRPVDPAGILRAIRAALRPAARYVCVDINCLEQSPSTTPDKSRLLYGFSLSYSLTVSLAEGGTDLGTCGLAEPVLRGMATDAAFRSVRHVPIDDPFNTIYELAC